MDETFLNKEQVLVKKLRYKDKLKYKEIAECSGEPLSGRCSNKRLTRLSASADRPVGRFPCRVSAGGAKKVLSRVYRK